MDKNKLIDAYSDLMAHIYEVMDDTLHSFADALDISKERVRESHSLTEDELNRVSAYVKRDVEHAAQGLPAQQDEETLGEWFKFEIELIENFYLDQFLSIADKTRIELAKIGEIAKKHTYESGDITSPGTFICDACGKEIAFKTPSEIPECPKCHGKVFVRI